MRIEAAVTSISWIPSEAVTGVTFQPTEFPELRADPEVHGSQAVFSQTVGGRTGVPFPRPVRGKPFFQWVAPTVWTTLRLTISADGTSAGSSAVGRVNDYDVRIAHARGEHVWHV